MAGWIEQNGNGGKKSHSLHGVPNPGSSAKGKLYAQEKSILQTPYSSRVFEPGKRRVVITGMGVVAANGQDLETFWNSVRDGVSAARPVTRFDVSKMPSKIAAEIQDFDHTRFIDNKHVRRLDLSTRYAIAAAVQAVQDSKIDTSQVDPDRIGIVEATSLSSMESAFQGQTDYQERGYRRLSPYYLINAYSGSGSGEIAIVLGIQGHAVTYSSGSASGNDAIGYALRMIQQDEVDVMLTGGTEAPLLPPLWGGFCVARVLTCQNDQPQKAMRPFDKNRDGFLMGEGAGFLVLEELGHALSRGAPIYAEVLGHGRSCEAYHSVAPHPEGVGLFRAMEKALRHAGLHPTEIDYINSHGTATESNDGVESLAIKRMFGQHAFHVSVSSTKPVTGHLLAAAGAVETIICAMALKHQLIPPTINLEEPADNCDLDYVPHRARPYPIRIAMNLSVGFGGKNACLLLGRSPQAL